MIPETILIALRRLLPQPPRAHAPAPSTDWPERCPHALTWGIWLVIAIIIGVIAAMNPGERTVTGVYRVSGELWLAGKPLYADIDDGFISLPQSAIVMAPLAILPAWAFEFVWRVSCAALFAASLFTMARRFAPPNTRGFFLIATLLVLPISLGTLRNGQINLPLAALFALAFAWISGEPRRPWAAAAALCLAFILKPIAIVPMLLAGVFVRGLWWRLLVGMLAVAALPFVTAKWDYALTQYQEGVHMVLNASTPYRAEFADLYGMLKRLGLEVGEKPLMLVRLIAAIITAAAALAAMARFDVLRLALVLHLLAASYLMFGNPRTEGVSYPILAVPLAALACLTLDREKKSAIGWLALAFCILLGTIHFITPPKDFVVRPLIAIIVWAWSMSQCVRGSLLPAAK